MAAPAPAPGAFEAAAASPRQHALADMGLASMGDPDLTPSEDETADDKALQLETVQSAIGVSIGQQQTRLTSPKTPAAEKAAALDETDGGGLFDSWEPSPEHALEAGPGSPSPPHDQGRDGDPSARPPSPWRAALKPVKRSDDHRAVLRDSLAAGSRRRALSGSSASEALRKYIPFSLPSMPKTSGLLNFSLPTFSVSSLDNVRGRPPPAAQDRRKQVTAWYSPTAYAGITQHDGSPQSVLQQHRSTSRPRSLSRPRHANTLPIPQRPFSADTEQSPIPHAPLNEPQERPAPRLRRSTSEGSLLLYRSRSFASSLGDDSRFENVQGQVNSRLKAIKDSWQDANFKLPSMPTKLPNFSFGSRDDLFKSWNASTTLRGITSDATTNSRVSFLATTATSTSRGSSMKPHKAKSSATDLAAMASKHAETHPYFSKALHDLTGDIIILGGYRGSVLRSAEPPNRQLWVPIKVGLNLRKVDLEVGLDPEDEENAEQRIIPAGMLTHIGPVDIAKRLFKRLRSSENAKNGLLRVHNYGYDWRLSPHLLSRRLINYLDNLPCNQPGVPPEKRGAIVIAHSLGGLITRHAINQRPELVAGVIYAGVPQTCVNILGPLRNGDDVLLSSRVLTAQVNFTIRTSYALLPLDGKCFINKHTKEEYPVDFFDINTWKEYCLSPCISAPLPPPNQTIVPNLSVSSLLNAMSQALPSLPSRKGSISKAQAPPLHLTNSPGASGSSTPTPGNHMLVNAGAVKDVARNAADRVAEGGAETTGMAPQMGHNQKSGAQDYSSSQPNPATTVTIPHDKAVAYLTRTLAEIKQFKLELAHRPEHTASNSYPPIALIYGKSTPTVYGAKVESREAIKTTSAYDELAFASGDGVVLARAAMVPDGYSVVRGGVVSSDRGHVTLLGDLEAVGRCLNAVIGARKNGVGLGKGARRERKKGEVEADREEENKSKL